MRITCSFSLVRFAAIFRRNNEFHTNFRAQNKYYVCVYSFFRYQGVETDATTQDKPYVWELV